jgi:hypothetical protein
MSLRDLARGALRRILTAIPARKPQTNEDVQRALDELNAGVRVTFGPGSYVEGETYHPPTRAEQEAAALRQKEIADHRAWLRNNATSVITPDHPAVTLPGEPSRAIVEALYQLRVTLSTKEQRDRLRDVERIVHDVVNPGERALSELLAEERAKGAAEERDAVCVWMSEAWGTQEDEEINAVIGEVVQDIRGGKHRRIGRAIHVLTQAEMVAALVDEHRTTADETREACARIADRERENADPDRLDVVKVAGCIADAIRALGGPDTRPLRERVLGALEAILPPGSVVKLDVILPGQVHAIEISCGFEPEAET